MDLSKYIKENENDLDFCLSELQVDVREQVARVMKSRGISLSELAENLSLNKSVLSRMLNSSNNLTLKSLMKICIALDYRPEIVLRPKEERGAFSGLQKFEESQRRVDEKRISGSIQLCPVEMSRVNFVEPKLAKDVFKLKFNDNYLNTVDKAS